MSRNLEETPSVLKILFQRGTYDIITGEAIKNEPIVSIPLEFLYKQPSINFRISYILVSLINHDGDSLNCGHYISDFFDAKTGIWWRCDYENITQIIDLPKGVILDRITKNKKQKIDVRLNRCIICGLYHNKPSDKIQLYFFQEFLNTSKINHMKIVIEDLNVFRKYFRVIQEVSDDIQTSISFIKY